MKTVGFIFLVLALLAGCVQIDIKPEVKIPETVTCTEGGNTITCTGGTSSPVTIEKPTLTISQVATSTGLVFAEEQRVRFTIFTLTATGGDVSVRSVTTERVGQGYDSSFTGVELLVNDAKVGHTEQLNINHQATIGETFIIEAGTSKTLVVAANMANDLSAMAGTVVGFTVVSIDTDATIVGVLPIVGAYKTLNNSLNIGGIEISASPLSPPYTIVASGSSDVDMGSHRLCPRSGNYDAYQVGLKLVAGSAQDIQEVSLWEGATEVGRAVFVGSDRKTLSTLTSLIHLNQNEPCKDITVKATLTKTGLAEYGTEGGFIQIEIDEETTQGVNLTYGVVVGVTTSGNHTNGVRMFKSFPTFKLGEMNGTGLADGKLLEFSMTADANGSVSTTTIATKIKCTGLEMSELNFFVYSDPLYTIPVMGFMDGKLFTTIALSPPMQSGNASFNFSKTLVLPAGTTYYFRLAGAVIPKETTYSCATVLLGDPLFSPHTGEKNFVMGTFEKVATAMSNLIWSPNTFGLPSSSHPNWTNGIGVPGLPGEGLVQIRSN